MLSRCLLLPALGAFLSVTLLAQEPPKREFPTDPRRDADASGSILKYDAERGTLLIGSGEGAEGSKQTTFLVDKHVQVLIDGKPGKLTDLADGQRVRLYLNQDRTTALSVQATGPVQRVTVSEVDAEKRTLKFRREGGTESVAVPSDATITLNGKDAKLAELQPGAQAILWLTVDRKTARIVQVGRRGSGEGEQPRRDADPRAGDVPKGSGDLTGKMIEYDRAKKTVTVATREGKGDRVTLLVDKGTEVVIDGKRGAITAIPDNHMVRVAATADGKVVARITANGPTQQRKVLAVNEGRRALQLERETDTEEVPVAADAAIVVNGKDAKITDVQPGDMATIRFAIDRKTILGIQVGLGKPVEGKIPVKE